MITYVSMGVVVEPTFLGYQKITVSCSKVLHWKTGNKDELGEIDNEKETSDVGSVRYEI